MIEEPYRWVEAIANRREYIETQLASGSPLVALSYRDGILFLTAGRARQKVFEIYDRIGLGAIGHPGDIERLRMIAIELASTEGFTRSAADVSLRRLAYYSLSPVLKTAFEQVYGAPYLARLLFAEVGATAETDLFLRLDYDGAIEVNGATSAHTPHSFGVLGTARAAEAMTTFLAKQSVATIALKGAFDVAVNAWTIGSMAPEEPAPNENPPEEAIARRRAEELRTLSIEAAILERTSPSAIRYRVLTAAEIKTALQP